MDGDSPRRSPRKKSLAEIKAEARKKINNKGGADPTVLVDDPDATALASKVNNFDCHSHKSNVTCILLSKSHRNASEARRV